MVKFDFNLPPKESVKYLEQKGYEITFNYDELLHEAHHKAFTVAKITTLDLLKDVHSSLVKAQAEGIPFETWKKNIKDTLISYGWYGKIEVIDPKTGEIKNINVNSHRLRTVFNTNMRTSYQVGRYKKMMSLEKEVYWRYVAILDSRVRPSHASLHGMVRHRDDPFWEKNYPPNGWGCRCKVQAYSEKQIKKQGWNIKSPEDKLPSVYKGPDKDWNYNVGAGATKHLENLLKNKESDFKQFVVGNSDLNSLTKNKEIETYAIMNNLAKKINLGRIPVEFSKETISIIEDLKKKYEQIEFDEITTFSQSTKKIITPFQHIVENKNGNSYKMLQINTAAISYFKNINDYNEYVKNAQKKGYWVPKTYQDLIIHEIGHNLTYRHKKFSENIKLDNLLENMPNLCKKAGIKSIYGDQEAAEAIAEAFVYWEKYKSFPESELKKLVNLLLDNIFS